MAARFVAAALVNVITGNCKHTMIHHRHDHAQHNDDKAHLHPIAGHDHSRGLSQRLLVIVLVLTFLYMIAEVIGGFLANSLALISDAGHMFTDVAALALSFLAMRFAVRPATTRKTYGFYRIEILAALVNGVTLIALSLVILVEAYHRLSAPEVVDGKMLLWVSTGGLAVNLIAAYLLSRAEKESLNIRGAFLHVLGDLLGSVAAIAAGALILWRDWRWADPAFSVLISVLIIVNAWRLVADAVNVLLEGTPSHIDVHKVEEAIHGVDGVRAVHDLHIWTITSGRHSLTAHVVIDDPRESYRILRELRELLASQFGLAHTTIQVEDPTFATVVNFKTKTTT